MRWKAVFAAICAAGLLQRSGRHFALRLPARRVSAWADDDLLPSSQWSIAVVVVGGTLISLGRGTQLGMFGGVLLHDFRTGGGY